MVKKDKKGTNIGTLIGLAIGGGAIIWLASQLKKAEAKKEEPPPTLPPTTPPTPPSTPPTPPTIPREEPKVVTVGEDFYKLPPASVSPWDKPINLKRITGENKTVSAREFVKTYTLTDMRNVQKDKKIDAPVFKFAQEAGLRPSDLVEQMKEGPSASKAAEAKKVEAAKAKADSAAIAKAKAAAGAKTLSTSLKAAVEKAAPSTTATTYKGTPPGYVLPQPEKTLGWIRPYARFGTIGSKLYGSPMTGYPIPTSPGATEAYIETGGKRAGPFSMKEAIYLQQLKDAIYCFTQELASGSIFGSEAQRAQIESCRAELRKKGIVYNPQVEPGVIEKRTKK